MDAVPLTIKLFHICEHTRSGCAESNPLRISDGFILQEAETQHAVSTDDGASCAEKRGHAIEICLSPLPKLDPVQKVYDLDRIVKLRSRNIAVITCSVQPCGEVC